MTEDEFLDTVRTYRRLHPAQRYGQAVFNVLRLINRPWANRAHGTELDTFDHDDRVPALLTFLRQNEVFEQDS